ncbi:MAG: hypothetical protein KIS92_13650 [Planctomycetota bacterium]|nr:hypothetical protein [Planctomycetota bacterium]
MSLPQPDYYAQFPDQPGHEPRKPGPSWLKIFVVGCLGLSALTLVIVVLGFVLGWSALVKFGIRDDLSNYQTTILSCDLDPDVSRALIHRMDAIREAVDGHNLGFMDWIPHDDAIQALLEDQELSELELERMDKELGQVEKALKLPVGSLPKPKNE